VTKKTKLLTEDDIQLIEQDADDIDDMFWPTVSMLRKMNLKRMKLKEEDD